MVNDTLGFIHLLEGLSIVNDILGFAHILVRLCGW
jgi:hypothetical protein